MDADNMEGNTAPDLGRLLELQRGEIAELELRLEEYERNGQMQSADGRSPMQRNESSPKDEHDTCVPWAVHFRLITKFNELRQSQQDLKTEHAKCQSKIDVAYGKVRKAKEISHAWKEWVDRSGIKTKDGRKERKVHLNPGPAPGDAASSPTPKARTPRSTKGAALAAKPPSNVLPVEGEASSREQQAGPCEIDASERGTEARPRSQSSIKPSRCVLSSQTTQGEPQSSPPAKRIRSNDEEPVFVSARPVNRRRGSRNPTPKRSPRIKPGPMSQSVPIELVSDAYSSPKRKPKPLTRTETSDLDKVMESFVPQDRSANPRASFGEPVRPPALLRGTSSRSDGDLPVHAEDSVDNMLHAPITNMLSGMVAQNRTHTSAAERQGDHVLYPLSPNIPTAPKLTDNTSNSKRKRHRDAGKAIELLSEGGDDQPRQAGKANEHSAATPTNEIRNRLFNLLGSQTEDTRELLPRRRTPISAHRKQPRPTSHPHAPPVPPPENQDPPSAQPTRRQPQRSSPIKHTPNQRPPKPYEPPRPPNLSPTPPPPSPTHEPLRSKPLPALNLSDFVINRAYADTTHAISDPLRTRASRRCAPGCTRPSCCGSHFKTAAALRTLPAPTTTDAAALEAYLGPTFDTLMRAFSPAKRADVMLEARAAEAAQMYGKHRTAFERRSTPPGFWRADMPSTQEAERDRMAADEAEREKVEERWREAMREGGRWVFRDER